jgi:hypothetical protein
LKSKFAQHYLHLGSSEASVGFNGGGAGGGAGGGGGRDQNGGGVDGILGSEFESEGSLNSLKRAEGELVRLSSSSSAPSLGRRRSKGQQNQSKVEELAENSGILSGWDLEVKEESRQ